MSVRAAGLKFRCSLVCSFVTLLAWGCGLPASAAGESPGGLNVIHDNSAVLIRPDLARSDAALKQDAVLNAQEWFDKNNGLKVIHVLYGTNAHPHIYKRIDIQTGEIRGINSNSLKISEWNAEGKDQLPGYLESAKHKVIFPNDLEHASEHSATIIGSYEGQDGGELNLSMPAHQNSASARKNIDPWQALRAASGDRSVPYGQQVPSVSPQPKRAAQPDRPTNSQRNAKTWETLIRNRTPAGN